MKFKHLLSLSSALFLTVACFAQSENTNKSYFKQLYDELPTPNAFRTASGYPGYQYYQQKADYVMDIVLDDEKQKITGSETVTYTNNSPDVLPYLWVQLDQNMRAKDSDTRKIQSMSIGDSLSFEALDKYINPFDGGFKLEKVTDSRGNKLDYTVNKTMMRIDLPQPLKPGATTSFKIDWWYNINDRMKIGGRSGYEYFEEEDNYLYTIAQFFPRMAVYNDAEGWQNKQFLGRGEFTLPFGDYQVNITVPSDHVVAATGELQNSSDVMTSTQKKRFAEARENTTEPVLIITQEEAEENEKEKAKGTKTWKFKATNVRDFGFASSRKFMWDAMAVKFGNRTVMAMSYYPKEGNPLWEQYSTRAVAHTIRSYSEHTFDYPYPVAISVNAKSIGMEYPMICFNYGRPEKDGTYTERIKYGVISVIIHEVGHNFFPMIVNSDERQWTWMDEGLNTFCQYMAEQEWDIDYPSRRGPAYKIVDYMKGDKSNISPIMTNSESIFQFGNNAYGKPATALNILRETVMGRELFDFAFKQYSKTWMFKHPTPADFFRLMEDASAVDLDWFWRGWFFTTDHVDLSIDKVEWLQVDSRNPSKEMAFQGKQSKKDEEAFIGTIRNKELKAKNVVVTDKKANDFYNSYDPFEPTKIDEKAYETYMSSLDDVQKSTLEQPLNLYDVTFSTPGGIPMPIIVEFEFTDGSKTKEYIPAEIWRMGDKTIKKLFYFEKEVVAVNLDPNLETADINRNNNYWPARVEPSRFKLYKEKEEKEKENPMQRIKRAEEMK